jgi:hypothetical protein
MCGTAMIFAGDYYSPKGGGQGLEHSEDSDDSDNSDDGETRGITGQKTANPCLGWMDTLLLMSGEFLGWSLSGERR